ncbi:MAG: hypothetical protein QCI82_04000 [Candidatus Thermoplasmatota archaeon]|nr:hypothetical protein [Candidatus Thermoplasmatota archaeon]
MDYLIISLAKDKGAALGKLVQDDLVSRQTLNIREAKGLGIEKDETYILIEGSDEALRKAVELISEEGTVLSSPEKERIRDLLRKADEEVAEGLGLMFG